NFSIWYKLTDRTRIGGYISLGGVAITLAINIIFIPIIQYPAPAWAALACYGFMAATSFYIGKKYYPVPYPIQRMLSYILIAVGVFSLNTLLLEMLQLEQLPSITLINTVFFSGYLLAMYLWERKTLLRFLG
ncbi:MAG: polysaccharide biosynthesis C-terminal domain-containing protein, partial [Saprospiraceae bacterium]